ncbi:MAG: AAA family ATPase [Byssovorax sp.]
MGKTCVLLRCEGARPEAGFRLTYCRNATLGRRDFYRYLCHALGLHPTTSAANLFLAVEHHIHEMRRDKIHPVFLLDEAHLLHPDMMAHLHILMNYEWDARALLSLVLIGLPELESNLSRRAHRSLLTRIHHRFLLAPATTEDTAEYVRYRLSAAGCNHPSPTTPSPPCTELSQGSLREIDRLASAALREAARRKKKLVERDLVTRAVPARPLRLTPPSARQLRVDLGVMPIGAEHTRRPRWPSHQRAHPSATMAITLLAYDAINEPARVHHVLSILI